MKGIAFSLGVMAATLIALGLVGANSAAAAGPNSVTLSYVVVGGVQQSPPVLSYILNGSPQTANLTTNPTRYVMDPASYWSVSQTLAGSNGTARWEILGPNTGLPGGQVLVLSYYKQYYVTFDVAVQGNVRTIRLPYVTFYSFGSRMTVYSTNSRWADALSPYSYGNANATLRGARWMGYGSELNGTIEGPGTISPSYIEQYLLNFSLISSGPDRLGPVTLTDNYKGGVATWMLAPPGGQFWADYGTSFSLPADVNANTGASRWSLSFISTEVANAPANVTVNYVEQYPLTVSFSTSTGNPPSGPVVTLRFNGQLQSFQAYFGGGPVWGDFGTPYSVSDVLAGSSTPERWAIAANATGTLDGSVTLNLDYYHQYLTSFDYSIVGGGSIGTSNVFYYNLGSQVEAPLTTSLTNVWVDAGTAIQVQDTFAGTSPIERLELGSPSSIIVSNSMSIPLVYYHQYSLQVSFSIQGGGAPSPPVITGVQKGTPLELTVLSGDTLWLDAGTPWSLSESLQSQTAGERWFAGGGENGTAGQQASVAVSYAHQYLLSIVSYPQAGGEVTQSVWATPGQSIRISASAAPSWAFVGWIGSGGGSYSGSNTTTSVIVQGPTSETAAFDLALVVQSLGGGTVQMTVGAHSYSVGGNPFTFYIAPGTSVQLTAKPGLLSSFAGWNGLTAGNPGEVVFAPTSPTRVYASFSANKVLDYGLAVLYFGFAVFAVFFLLRNRRFSRPNFVRQLWSASHHE